MVVDKDEQSRWVDSAAIEPGMVMLVAAGERLAADGIVVGGASRIDLSLLTGESAPQAVRASDPVQIGRASGRERVCQYGAVSGVAVALKTNHYAKKTKDSKKRNER